MRIVLSRTVIMIGFTLLTTIPAAAGLDYATFVGGSGSDSGKHIDLDSSGNIVILGTTWSSDFPTTPGAFDTTFDGDVPPDLVIVKLSPDLSTLLAATYLSGDNCGTDPMTEGLDLLVGADNTVYVTGNTWCATFPTTPDSYQPDLAGYTDGFLVRLSADLTTLLYGTFLGNTYSVYTYESSEALAMDSDGWIYTSGWSEEWIYVQKWAADLHSFGGGQGGYWACDPLELTVNQDDGTVYMVGTTWTSAFTATPGAFDTTYNGGDWYGDLVVKSFDTNFVELEATFIGGQDDEMPTSVDLAANGNLRITGFTESSAFPVTSGAYDTSYNGGTDGFTLEISADLSTLVAGTFLGSTGYDSVNGSAITPQGTIALVGETDSPGFPVTPNAWDATSINRDGFIAELSGGLDQLVYSTFIGGDAGLDYFRGMRIDADGRVVGTGYSRSSDFPVTPGAYDTGLNGTSDIVAVVFDLPGIDAELTCTPPTGTLPLSVQFIAGLINETIYNRRLAAHIDIQLAGGGSIPSWRAGFTNLSPGENYMANWQQNFPALGTLQGTNVFTLQTEDVTPAPYNQPPYPPSGETASAGCTVTGLAP